jgi:hypothetical protein
METVLIRCLPVKRLRALGEGVDVLDPRDPALILFH